MRSHVLWRSRGRPPRAARTYRHLFLTLLLAGVLFGVPAAAVAMTGRTGGAVHARAAATVSSIPSNFFTVVDQGGPNDVNASQVDLTQMGRDDTDPTVYKLFWSWDATDDWTGTGQTGDACALFDKNNNGDIDYAICGQITNQAPDVVVETASSPYVQTCSDQKPDRCTQPSTPPADGWLAGALVASGNPDPSPPANLVTPTDPFPDLNPDQNWPNDSTLEVVIPKASLGGAKLVNVCSYPSQGNGANNNPFDCIVNPGGGFLVIHKTAPSGSFDFSVDGGGAVTVAADANSSPITLAIGTGHTVAESVPAGWNLESASCKLEDGTSTGSLSGSTVSSVEIQSGEITTCTFTDAPDTGSLKLTKSLSGGPSDYSGPFTVNYDCDDGTAHDGSVSLAAGASQTISGIPTGTQCTVSESLPSAPSGYTFGTPGYSPSATATIATDTTTEVVVDNTLTRDTGSLKLTKSLTGGPSDYSGPFTVNYDCDDGTAHDGSVSLAAGASQTISGIPTGTQCTVSESLPSAPSGYTFGTPGYSPSATATIGSSPVEVVVNNTLSAQPAHLTVVKHVVNDDGGSAVAGDFTIAVTGTNPAPASFAGSEEGTTVALDAGSYSVDETAGPAGYAKSLGAGCSGTLAPGASATCTITNDDAAATLTVEKVVVNDNGGTAKSGDFTMTVTGSSPSPASFAGSASGTVVSLEPGSYSVAEAGPDGYAASASQGCAGTIALGQHLTCTITNDDRPGTLVVKKVVVNDNGGTKVASDFSFSVNGGQATAFDASGTNSLTVDAGTYTVTEPSVQGYTASYDGCADVVVGNGQTKTCTITNDDTAPSLTLDKVVVNNNGGSAAESDWTLTATGPTTISGPGAVGHADVVSGASFDKGTYTLSESAGPAGYQASAWSCVENGGNPVEGSSITLGLGDSAVCTITNDDKAGTLVVKKVVVNDNGGTKTAADFSFSVNGGQATAFDASGTNSLTVDAGTYTVTEPSVQGYTASYDGCADVVVANGETKTCTITNDDKAGTLVVKKVVVNDSGGTKVAADFSFSVNGGQATAFDASGTNSLTVDAGTYTVTEPSVDGYTASYDGCADVVVANGQTKTCTITNDDKAGTLVVKKVVVNDSGGTKVAADFSFSVNGGQATAFDASGTNSLTVDAGTYTVTEPSVDGYTTSYDGCADVVVANGESKTCTITNDDVAPQLRLRKVVLNRHGGTAVAGDWTLTATGTLGEGATNLSGRSPVDSGAGFKVDRYTLGEQGPAGYSGSWSCLEGGEVPVAITDGAVTLALGQNVTCTATNTDVAGTLTVIKNVVNNDGGTATPGSFTMAVTGTGPSPASFPGSSSGTTVSIGAGAYSVGESGPGGYAASYSAGCSGTMALGQSATCVVTNDDIANPPPAKATLTVVKHVVNDNAGTAKASDFTMHVTGTNPSESAFPGSESGTTITLDAGSYSVTETGPGGYHTSLSSGCSGTLAAGESATCTLLNEDIPPVVPTPIVDLSLTKVDTPDPVVLGDLVTYTLTVTNKVIPNGQFSAGNVTLADPLPAGVAFVNATSSRGTCTIASNGLSCALGTLAAGDTVTITLTARAETVGTVTNTAVVMSTESDANPADNTASAVTTVNGPFKPPATCAKVLVKPMSVKVGKRTVVVIVVRDQSGKPLAKASVHMRGPGVDVRGKTAKNGVYKRTFSPKRPGIVVVRVPGPAACIGRLGVVGVFQPPVTG